MISVESNATQVANAIKKLKHNLPIENKKALLELAKIGKRIAVNAAPSKSGALRHGIYYKVFKNKAEIISAVPKSFPYHFWVNQNIPTIRARFPYFDAGQGEIAYGQSGAIAPSGKPINWTGSAGYFNETAKILTAQFGKKFSFAVETAIRKSR